MKKNLISTPKWRQLAGLGLAIFLSLLTAQQVQAQCNNPAQFGTINAPTNNTPTTITTCAFGGEYSTINNATAGSTYLFSATGGTGNYLTVRQGTPGGTVLGFGFSPISVVCTVSGPLYLHYNTTAACGTDGSCHTGVVQCTSCPGAPDPCTSIATINCATPTTAALSGSGLWNVTACGFSTPGPEKVYSFTATATGVHNLQVTTTNSGGFIDYYFKAASGGCSSTGWTCIDDIFSPVTATIGTLTAGTTYYILLDAETTSPVTHTFQINCPAFDPCASIPVLACATSVTASSTGTGAWSPNSCGFSTPGQEKLYSFTPTTTGIHTLVVTATNSSYSDYFFKDASGGCNATGWTCIDDVFSASSTTFGPLTAGVTYYILYDPESTGTVTQTFRIDCPVGGSTPPCLALPTSPSNGQTGLCPSATTTLSWPVSSGATGYDVYFGTSNPPPFVGSTAATSFAATTPTAATYFWQIRPTNGFGAASGCVVWSFTKVSGAFTVPAFGASTVACPSLIVQPPAPPAVTTNCGTTVTPTGPTITNNPNPITCEGTRTYTWTYNNGFGQISTWNHVVTVERQPFSISTPNGAATVACPDQTDTQPTPPAVTSNCGEVLTPVVTSTPKPGCEGNRNWVFTYTDCEGNQATWSFIYTVEYQDFAIPASETLTIHCPTEAMEPVPPMVLDNCGKAVNMSGPVVSSTDNAQGCEASRSYVWTYQDCEGNTHTWGRTYNIQYTGEFFIYPNGEENVGCVLYAVPPFPPTVYDNCGLEVKVTGPTVSESLSGCSGTRTYTYIYTSCTGASKTWTYTFFANDNEPPIGNCTSGSLASVDVTNLSCIASVPCPDSYDFSAKAQELLAAGGFYDVCSGGDLTIELDSWTDLWECSDPDGNGVNTFGRTFYFRIADQCGNEYPTLCGLTYSGVCTPIETFPMQAWGLAGGEPGTVEGTTDVAVIGTLLNNNPLVVGGGNRSLTFTDANCVVALLPGLGTPTVLSNCHQTDCTGGCNPAGPEGMKNALAANTAALMLNMRYNVSYNALAMATVRNQSLGCIDISPNISYCTGEPAVCKLRVFESNGTPHEFPYTIGGLVDLANLYLGGNLQLTATFSSLYAVALNQSVGNVNEYFHGDMALVAGCDPDAGVAPGEEQASNKSLPTIKGSKGSDFSLSPNPTANEVTVKLSGLAEAQNVVMTIYNSLGQAVLSRDFGSTAYLNERIDLQGIGGGLYIVTVKAGSERYEQKLVINRN